MIRRPHALPRPGETAKRSERTASPWSQVRPLKEELASAAIQGGAAAASAACLVYLVIRAGPRQDAAGLTALIVYAVSMFIAFLVSALYHGVQNERVKPILQKIDHCTIFVLIAGTYTPVAMLPLRHHDGVALLAAIWALAAVGIVLRLGDAPPFRRIAIPLYLLMGWLGLGWSAPLYRAIGPGPSLLMIAGAISYTSGLLFYRWQHRQFTNSVWHLFVVAGGTCFFIAIARFAPA
jgi:hemolysin III